MNVSCLALKRITSSRKFILFNFCKKELNLHLFYTIKYYFYHILLIYIFLIFMRVQSIIGATLIRGDWGVSMVLSVFIKKSDSWSVFISFGGKDIVNICIGAEAVQRNMWEITWKSDVAKPKHQSIYWARYSTM